MKLAGLLLAFLAPSCAAPIKHKIHRVQHSFSPEVPTAAPATSRHAFKGGSDIPFAGGLLTLGYYWLTVEAGTPPQSFKVLLDTGSANLGLYAYEPSKSTSAKEIKFGSPECRRCTPYANSSGCLFGSEQRAISDPSLCGYGISYGGGSSYIQGHVVEDTVMLGNLSVETMIIKIDRDIPGGSFNPVGIIGFANEENAVGPTYTPTIFSVAQKKYGLDNVIGMCLSPASGGQMVLGGVDETKYDPASLMWMPQTHNRWFNIATLDVVVGGASIGLPPFVYQTTNDCIGSFPDSGTSVFLLGPVAFDALKATFQAGYSTLPGVADGSIFAGACLSKEQMGTHLNDFPRVTITVAGEQGKNATLFVPPTSYFLTSNNQYCLGITGVPGIGAILGDVVMENYYWVHDKANKRVGAAPLTAPCDGA